MITRACHQGPAEMEQLARDCRNIVLKARLEQDQRLLPLKARTIGILGGGCTGSVLLILAAVFSSYISSWSLEKTAYVISLACAAGILLGQLASYLKGGFEISEYLYLTLIEMKRKHPDFSDINEGGKPILLDDLERMMMKLLKILDFESKRAARTEFFREGCQPGQLFSFHR